MQKSQGEIDSYLRFCLALHLVMTHTNNQVVIEHNGYCQKWIALRGWITSLSSLGVTKLSLWSLIWLMTSLSFLIHCSEFRSYNSNFGLSTGSVDSFKNLPSICHYILRAKSILIKIKNLVVYIPRAKSTLIKIKNLFVYIVRTFVCYFHLFSWNAVHLDCFLTHGIWASVKWEFVQTGQGYHSLPGMHWMNFPPQLSKWGSDLCYIDINSYARESTLTLLFSSLFQISVYLSLAVMALL